MTESHQPHHFPRKRRPKMKVTKNLQPRRWPRVLILLGLLSLLVASAAFADDPARLVIFGDSLSDPGNYFIAFGTVSRPLFVPIPDAPYAVGGHHFSNGATWAEQLAKDLHQPTSGKPALRAPGVFTNYAVGRARARAGAPAFPFYDLSTQVGLFLSDFGGRASADAVYVVWIGANDLDDALNAWRAISRAPRALALSRRRSPPWPATSRCSGPPAREPF